MSFEYAKIDYLDVNKINGSTYPPSSSGPTYTSVSINPLMFGSSSDALSQFCCSNGTAPSFYAPTELPWPSNESSMPDYTIGITNFGTVLCTLVPGNYGLCSTWLGNGGTGIATFTVANLTTIGPATTIAVDTYQNNNNNPFVGGVSAFTVGGTGYQNISINLSCSTQNPSSVGYLLLPSANVDIFPVNSN